jgi:hypothetical protein
MSPDAEHGVDGLLERLVPVRRVSAQAVVHEGTTSTGKAKEDSALHQLIEQVELFDQVQGVMERD